MKTLLTLLCVTAMVGLYSPVANAGDSIGEGTFPGVGDQAKWESASHIAAQGQALFMDKRYDESMKLIGQAISIYPYDPAFFITQGACQTKKRDPKSAEISYTRALALNPKHWMAWKDLGKAQYDQDKNQEAVASWKKALASNPPPNKKIELERDIKAVSDWLAKQAK